MAAKPRTTRKRPKKQQNGNNSPNSPTESSGGIFDALGSMSVAQKVGLGVSAMALLSTAAIKLSGSTKVSLSDKNIFQTNVRNEVEISGNLSFRNLHRKRRKVKVVLNHHSVKGN